MSIWNFTLARRFAVVQFRIEFPFMVGPGPEGTTLNNAHVPIQKEDRVIDHYLHNKVLAAGLISSFSNKKNFKVGGYSLTILSLQPPLFYSGRAYDYPHLGAAGVIADEYLPKAEVEGETDQYFPQAGITGPLIFSKALRCLNDKYIYSSCEEPHRLTESGELHVPHEYTDEYCKGPCLAETHHVLECIDKILRGFIFLNRATLDDVRDTIESGCSYGPKRGNFDVVGRIQAGDASKKKVSNGVVYGLVMMGVVWRLLL